MQKAYSERADLTRSGVSMLVQRYCFYVTNNTFVTKNTLITKTITLKFLKNVI